MKFQDPPVIRGVGRPVKWEAEAATLRENPGRWALVMENASKDITYTVKNGSLKAFRPAGDFEAVACNIVGTKGDIYIRYVGKTDA